MRKAVDISPQDRFKISWIAWYVPDLNPGKFVRGSGFVGRLVLS